MGSLVLVRHATTAASEAGRNLGQRSDLPLNEAGLVLADRLGTTLAAELAELPHDEMRVVSSPALRCRQTAAGIAAGLGIDSDEIETAPGLIEIDYGAWDGLSADECRARDPELRAAWEADPFTTRCPDGESGSDVAERAFAVLSPIERWLADDRARCAVAVAHNHVNRVRLCDLLGWPMREYRDRLMQDPGSYNLITFGNGAPVVRRFNVPAA
ncbi:MAG: histidine phosphatase family protein [Candidatus Limnocylindria bacterium]